MGSIVLGVSESIAGELITLRRYVMSDVGAVKESIAASFDELHRWMPWAQTPPTDESVIAFVEPSATNFGVDDANFAITLSGDGRFVGSSGLMRTDEQHALEIGYWVDSRFTGRGIATASARLLTNAAFGLPQIDRIVVRCDAANVGSAKVPAHLGFALERTEERRDESSGEAVVAMTWTMRRERWKSVKRP